MFRFQTDWIVQQLFIVIMLVVTLWVMNTGLNKFKHSHQPYYHPPQEPPATPSLQRHASGGLVYPQSASQHYHFYAMEGGPTDVPNAIEGAERRRLEFN